VLDAIPSLYEHKNKWLTGTNILLAINFGLFAAMTVTGVSPGLPTSADLLRWGADYGPDTLGGQYWRLVTSCFVHIGLVHLAVNMYSLRLLGKAAEKLFRPAEIIAVYLLTGVGGSILSLSWNPNRVSAGASGALFGIIGVLASVLYKNPLGLEPAVRQRLFSHVSKLALFNLLLGLMNGIDNMAHMGGLVTGLILGYFVARGISASPEQRRFGSINLTAVSLVILAVTTAAVAKSKSYLVYLNRGIEASRQEDCNASVEYVRKYLQTRPPHDDAGNTLSAHSTLAYCLHKQNKISEAEQEYNAVLDTDPRNRWARVNLATLKLGRDDTRAAGLFEEVLASSKLDANEYRAYGKALAGMHRWADAEIALRKSLELAPNDPETHAQLADVLAAEGKLKESAKETILAAHKEEE
jgi:membrane associated rhomboid family serine protease/Flp pilus assembly protein TadD